MAAITAAVVVAAGSAYAANRQGAAQEAAGRAQREGAQDAQRMFGEQYDQTRQDLDPWMTSGRNALDLQNAYLSGDTSGFDQSADYLAAQRGGIQAVNRAAIGNLSGGGTAADLLRFGQDNAQQYGNNYYARLQAMNNSGFNAANALGNFGQNYAANYGQQANNIGNANGMIASAGPMTQAGYGNALASGASAWAGGGMGGFGSGSGPRASSYAPTNYGAFAPQQPTNYWANMIQPSNGQSWNFGPGTY